MATHSNVLAWRIPGTREPGGLPSMGSQGVGHRLKGLSSSSSSYLKWGRALFSTSDLLNQKNMPACPPDRKRITHTPMCTDVQICQVPPLFQKKKKGRIVLEEASREADWPQEDSSWRHGAGCSRRSWINSGPYLKNAEGRPKFKHLQGCILSRLQKGVA